jgi:hypothetical protein
MTLLRPNSRNPCRKQSSGPQSHVPDPPVFSAFWRPEGQARRPPEPEGSSSRCVPVEEGRKIMPPLQRRQFAP